MMPFISFEVSPMVNSHFCHICFGTGKLKTVSNKEVRANELADKEPDTSKCSYCNGKGFLHSA